MNCVVCNFEISSKVAPYGCYICSNNHLQCHICNEKRPNRCGMCSTKTSFIQMRRSEASETSLSEEHPDMPKSERVARSLFRDRPKNVTVMHSGVTRRHSIDCISDEPQKKAMPNIDIQMEKVLGTLKEEPRQKPFQTPKPANIIKLPKVILTPAGEKKLDVVYAEKPTVRFDLTHPKECGINQATNAKVKNRSKSTENLVALVSKVCRAHYNPPSAPLRPIGFNYTPRNEDPPAPQFQLVTCDSLLTDDELSARLRLLNVPPVSAIRLNISQIPLPCPIGQCSRLLFVGDLSKHVAFDHPNLPLQRIAKGEYQNFFIDPRATNKCNRCHVLFMIRDKICDLGNNGCLPVFVMTSQITLAEILGVPASEIGDDNIDYLMVWLSGLVAEEYPVSFTLTVWARGDPTPAAHLVISSQVYCMRKPCGHLDIFHKARPLVLPASVVYALTKGAREMMEMQLVVY